ncbi:MAG: acyl-CoA reductase [Capsulimonadales bacterium]|nr:acyl-CoA reductase [Capsulimonadales bacterium]
MAQPGTSLNDIIGTLASVGEVWEQRLATGWAPPPGSAFPWTQVRLSLAALIPGLRSAGVGLSSAAGGRKERTAALIPAGNTPLMSWAPLCACLLAGFSVRVKMSRDETLWPRLFVESLAEVAPAVAARIALHVWPGDDPRTAELVRSADAVIAYGSDATIERLRTVTPARVPFFGFGHSVSVGIATANGETMAGDFASDVLLYDQGGCLSLQSVICEGGTAGVAARLTESLKKGADRWDVPPRTDPAVAAAVRNARDMALFAGARVYGDHELRWTVIEYPGTVPLPPPTGYGVVHLIPVADLRTETTAVLRPLRGALSCVGVAGELAAEERKAVEWSGVSRICRAGTMQTPPLDWPNGNIDLRAALCALGESEVGGGDMFGAEQRFP